jgi:hypothetical protein
MKAPREYHQMIPQRGLMPLSSRKWIVQMTEGVLGTVVLLTLVQWIMLGYELPFLFRLPGWFWQPIHKACDSLLSGVVILVCAGCALWVVMGHQAWLAREPCKRAMLKLGLLICLGYCIQMGYGYLEGRGIDGIRDRMVKTGHAEFARVAVQQDSILRVMTDYENLLERGELGRFAKSKPPGTLVLYMVTERLSRLLTSPQGTQKRFEHFATVSAYLWPFISVLVLLPVFFFVRTFLSPERALYACLLLMAIPSVNLMTLHTDQTFYPLLFMTSIYSAMLACQTGRLYLAVVSGVCFYVAVYCSFVLVGAMPISALVSFAVLSHPESKPSTSLPNHYLWQYSKTWLVILAIIVGLGLLFWLALHYDVFRRYQDAVAHHVAWKRWRPGMQERLYFGLLNLLEFFFWLGMPVAVASLAHMRYAMKKAAFQQVSLSINLSLALLGSLLYLAFFGKTKGEVARLWLFLVPLVTITAVEFLHVRFKSHLKLVISCLFILQLLTVYFIKRFQDFW